MKGLGVLLLLIGLGLVYTTYTKSTGQVAKALFG